MDKLAEIQKRDALVIATDLDHTPIPGDRRTLEDNWDVHTGSIAIISDISALNQFP